MNRKQRRAAKSVQRTHRAAAQLPDANIAAHEAGHAIAHYLTAAELGYSPDEAIDRIEFAGPDASVHAGRSLDGKVELGIQATTFGPTLTKEMDYVADRVNKRIGLKPGQTLGGREAFSYLSEIVSEARADGIDIETWLQARALITVMGSMVEALQRRESFYEIWESYRSEHDAVDFIRVCRVARVPKSEISSRIDAAVERAVELLQDSNVIDALNALANHLIQNGTTDGVTAARIIGDAMGTKAV